MSLSEATRRLKSVHIFAFANINSSTNEMSELIISISTEPCPSKDSKKPTATSTSHPSTPAEEKPYQADLVGSSGEVDKGKPATPSNLGPHKAVIKTEKVSPSSQAQAQVSSPGEKGK